MAAMYMPEPEEYNDMIDVKLGKMTKQEFNSKWLYKTKQLKAIKLYKKQLNV